MKIVHFVLRIPNTLNYKIDKLAKAESRSKNKWIVLKLEELTKESEKIG